MFGTYEEYDNIDNDFSNVNELYSHISIVPDVPLPPSVPINLSTVVTPVTNKPIINSMTNKKVRFVENMENDIPGSPPTYDIFKSCGSACSKKDYPSRETFKYSKQKNNVLSCEVPDNFNFILFIIICIFMIYIKQRVDRLESIIYMLLYKDVNAKIINATHV